METEDTQTESYLCDSVITNTKDMMPFCIGGLL